VKNTINGNDRNIFAPIGARALFPPFSVLISPRTPMTTLVSALTPHCSGKLNPSALPISPLC
jgi:hypothetical protein